MKVLWPTLIKALFVSLSILLTLGSSVVFAQSPLKKDSVALKKSLSGSTSKGGVSDGGSTGIYVGHRLFLLDLYIANPLIRDENAGSPLRTHPGQPWARVIVKEQPAYQQALRYVNDSNLPHITKAVIAKALGFMEFWSIDDELPVRRAYLPEWLKSQAQERIKTVAMYSEDYGGAAISKRAWNQLGATSQAAVLIHEALRHVQFVDEEKENANHLTDDLVQELTAHIVLGTAMESKQLGWYLDFINAANDVAAREARIAKVCHSIQIKFPAIYPKYAKFCSNPIPTDEVAVLNFLTRFAEVGTNLLPEMLRSQQTAREFLRIRDEAQVLFLENLYASVLVSKFGFMQLRYRLNTISF